MTSDPGRPVSYAPLKMYERWMDEVLECAQEVLLQDSLALFTLDSAASHDIHDYTWYVVPTEAGDGSYPCRIQAIDARCVGTYSPGVFHLSAQFVFDRVVVKHELLHAIVVSKGEDVIPHGTPWGLCNYL